MKLIIIFHAILDENVKYLFEPITIFRKVKFVREKQINSPLKGKDLTNSGFKCACFVMESRWNTFFAST